MGAEEVDRQVPIQRGAISQVVEEPDAGIVDQDILIFGLLTDQPALHGLLIKVRDLGLVLMSVRRLDEPCQH